MQKQIAHSKTIQKWILEKQGVMVLAGFNWFTTGVVVGFCVQNNMSVIHLDLQLQE